MPSETVKANFSLAFVKSLAILIVLIYGVGLLFAYGLYVYFSFKFSLMSAYLSLASMLIFGWSWATPTQIQTWSGSGIDEHPERENSALIDNEFLQYSLWKQPQRLKYYTAFFVLTLSQVLLVISETWAI